VGFTCEHCKGVIEDHSPFVYVVGKPVHEKCEPAARTALADPPGPYKRPAAQAVDQVNSPSHYARLNPEPVDVIEAWGLEKNWYRASALKYLARAGYKDSSPEGTAVDLEKAAWHLQREADRIRKAGP
jgi:hypothetical protein